MYLTLFVYESECGDNDLRHRIPTFVFNRRWNFVVMLYHYYEINAFLHLMFVFRLQRNSDTAK